MSFLRKKQENEDEFKMNEFEVGRTYIDLGIMKGKSSDIRTGGPAIRFADIDGYRQIPDLSNLIYEGNVLILDFTPIANDDLELKRTITELKRVIEDIDGDIAGIGQNLLIATPKGMPINKKKIRKNR